MARYYPFEREDVFPSFFANRIQDFLAGARTDLRISRVSATKIAVDPDPDLGVSAIAIEGRWRFNEAIVEREHPGGGKATYTVWAVALDNDVDNVPDPLTDHTVYAFDLRITNGEDPSGAGVEIFQKIGEIDWSGAAIETIRQTYGSTPAPQLEDDVLDSSAPSDITWSRAAGGGFIAAFKPNSVGAAELADESVDTLALINLAVTTAKIAAEAITEAKLANNSVAAAKIVALAVETAKIAALAVTEEKLAAEAVSTAKIKALAVTAAKLAAEAVETGKIANLAVTAAKLAAEAVETAKIKDKAVTAPKIAILPGCRVTRETAQSIPDSTYTPVSWTGTERWDTEGIHNPAENPDRLTCKVAGLYIVQGYFAFAGDPDGLRNAVISVNEAVLPVPGKAFAEHSEKGMEAPAPGAGGNAISIAAIIRLEVGDIVRLLVWQNSGAALNIMAGDAVHITEFAMAFIGSRPT